MVFVLMAFCCDGVVFFVVAIALFHSGVCRCGLGHVVCCWRDGVIGLLTIDTYFEPSDEIVRISTTPD